MIATSNIGEIRSERLRDGAASWGLVPTMGALHSGHISLIKTAKNENDKVAVSIFVNPIQFNNPDDLARYPADLEKDIDILKKEEVDLVWIPEVTDIYPDNYQTYIEVDKISKPLEGESRPGHFKGVATVVAILFNVFQPNRAYFGQKDGQQLLVIRQMVNDLKFNLDIVVCPTVRETDGLAVSSRNKNLSEQGRSQATCLYTALSKAEEVIQKGEKVASKIKTMMSEIITQHSLSKIDYISIADPDSLEDVETIDHLVLIYLAVFIEDVRLIDNMVIEPTPS
jgi:pantoate--beta-alanine ligase